jgi:3-oxoacyl-[acyl-carrier-protein] synthase-3
MGATISKISVYLPENILTNENIVEKSDRLSSEKIEAKIGVRERRISGKGQTAGDLAFKAAESVLENYNRKKIDMIILCTQSPDYFLPTTACTLQNRLGLNTNTAAFDYNLGCSGYVYGLAMAKSFINTKIANKILLIMSETYSKHIHEKDLANRTIFGDAAAATIIEKSEKEYLLEFVLGTDGSGMNNLIVPNNGFRNLHQTVIEDKMTNSGDVYSDNHLYMNGPEIFNFTIDAVPKAVNECLDKNCMTIEDVDYVIFHQANKFMINFLRKKIKIPKEKFYSNMLKTGNTVSATIPIALSDSLQKKIIKEGDKVLLCGFGVGYSWGAVIIEI